ncbi:MAG TPA: penicillin-binding protein 1A [Desulfotomaculum sp.]|nr:MAG: Penicillin-binding protein, 1A family [Desulfotomaculum sp. 46_80]HAG10928.1 penicillin-binding protein 1A [Desulfotomaculum sp.]HBY03965.1 penicillin-binding protein 1A [Desulfotomaculum sp.]
MPKKRKKRLNPKRLVFLIVLIAFLVSLSGGLFLLTTSIMDLPALDENKLYSSAASSYYDQDGNLFARIGEENREIVKIKDIPVSTQDAFIAIEDVRFKSHHGVDLRGIARALWHDLTGGNMEQGASTITQQLVKLSFLNPEKKVKRKIQEAILSLMVERRYSKGEILEMYLNKVYFGNGAYGIQSAARTYFNKNVDQLTLSQSAFLAGLLKAPNYYSLPEKATARRDVVLDTMLKYGFITKDQADEAEKESLNIEEGLKKNLYPYPYFIDFVTKQLIEDFGEDTVYKGGLQVYTTMDRQAQQAAETALASLKNFPASWRDSQNILQPEGAAVFIDPQTGYIRALVGGREHTHQLQFDRATMARRQPGSSFKPIINYAPAIEIKGMGPASVIDDIPVSYGSYTPHNYDGVYLGLITMRTAVTRSINIPAVKTLVDHVGISNAVNFAKGLGITVDPNNGASMALGGLHKGVTPLQMATAYAAFANGGFYIEPTAILKVEDQEGKVLKEYKSDPQLAMKPTTAFLITSMLKDVVDHGTGTNARLNRPAAGKTGTTDEGKDLWFVGYTPSLAGAVWIGYDSNKPMPQEFGGRYPALIWRQIMQEALKNIPATGFRQPAGIVTATVDNKSGLLPGPNTPSEDMTTDLFVNGTVPTEVDNTHVLVEICAQTGLLASEYCPDRIAKIMIKLPYSIPDQVADKVADHLIRAPEKVCTEHRPGLETPSIQPGFEQDPPFLFDQ